MATDTETAAAISSHNTAANGHTSRGNTAGRPASPTTGDVYVNTQTGFVEVYTGATYGWEQVGAIASAPTSVVATNQGSSRAYNNGQSSVAFTAGTVAGRTYTVTSSPGSYTATGSTSPLTVTGLQSNTSYTYTVTATNNYGTSSASSASSSVTATTVPQAPTIGTPTAGDSSVSLAFTEGATGGSSITNYKYSTDNSTYTAFSPAQTTSPLSITGLTNGTSYQFYLKAVNANGDSQASSASTSVTPTIQGSFESIATVTLSSGASSITFSSIPQTYKHLQIRCISRDSRPATALNNWHLQLNSDSGTNYSVQSLFTDSSTVTAAADPNLSKTDYFIQPSANATPNVFQASIWDILDYSSTSKYKTIRVLGGYDNNGSGRINFSGAGWRSFDGVTSLTFTNSSNSNFNGYSSYALYGIKG